MVPWGDAKHHAFMNAKAKKNGHLRGRKTKDTVKPGMKTKTWQNPFTKLEASQ